MKLKYYLPVVVLILAGRAGAQSISLTPVFISPSSFTITTALAGSTPADPLTNYTSQSVQYSWPFFGGDNLVSNITVSSTSIPSGISVTVKAASGRALNGTSQGEVLVDSSLKKLISAIWAANNITRLLTQSIKISDFSQLHPGTYVVTINYTLQ